MLTAGHSTTPRNDYGSYLKSIPDQYVATEQPWNLLLLSLDTRGSAVSLHAAKTLATAKAMAGKNYHHLWSPLSRRPSL